MPELRWLAPYRRHVAASLERAWENVLDWEHLPVLHAHAFRSIECEDAGKWGWRAEVGLAGADAAMRIALTLEEPGDRYVVRTVEGPGEGTEIWTRLTGRGEHETEVEVRFGVPGLAPEHAATVGKSFVELYARLWDEDEGMMVERERALRRLRARDRADRIDLGAQDALVLRAPVDVEARGRVYRVEREGEGWRAYGATCPHRLGPLERRGEELRCPWHGYRFDLARGRSCDGRRLSTGPAPRLEIDDRGHVLLLWESRGAEASP